MCRRIDNLLFGDLAAITSQLIGGNLERRAEYHLLACRRTFGLLHLIKVYFVKNTNKQREREFRPARPGEGS